MFKREPYGSRPCDPRHEFLSPYRPRREIEQSEPEEWHKPDKYDPDSFWDGETIDDDKGF